MENTQAKPTNLIGSKLLDGEFEAFSNNKITKVKLEETKGKWLVLFFYPADFTFVCPTELGEMADNYDEFVKINTEIISVSTDTVFVHKAWFDNSKVINKIRFPMLADPAGILCKALGTYIPNEGLSNRASVIIDPDGIIKSFEINDNSIGRSATELLRKLKAAQYVREHNGEVCPASWQPGSSTLKPGLELVGKI